MHRTVLERSCLIVTGGLAEANGQPEETEQQGVDVQNNRMYSGLNIMCLPHAYILEIQLTGLLKNL